MCYVRTTTEKNAVIFDLCLGNRMIIDRGVVVYEKLRFAKKFSVHAKTQSRRFEVDCY